MEKTCGNCVFLITDDGEPWCCLEDMYTHHERDEAACECWEELEDGEGN